MKVTELFEKLDKVQQTTFLFVFGDPAEFEVYDNFVYDDLEEAIYTAKQNAPNEQARTLLADILKTVVEIIENDQLPEQEFSEIFDNYCQDISFERGSESIEKMAEAIGYRRSYISPTENFLGDNPGAVEAIHNWIGQVEGHAADIWKENLIATIRGEELPHEL